ncbi:hypothetical protein CFAEC_02435 [Corynebacterium faecale]|uniref:type VII secretion-associated protein n=1 Tax=Corynebacterium faecale TaxID=1758466 RepID=UPI0025B5BE70|nr:type VII secretion-associated protein [Corynebacterium faecale]WJY91342.1 hypothetical protein CFAEC_02435 [Corynebacterium faecale]
MTEVLTVTVLETATIFEGPDTVYRYDIMATGILEGWAIPAVVDQVQQLSSVYWPEVEVIIDADDKVTDMLTKTFIGKGVTSYPIETLREHPLPESEQDPDPDPGPVVMRPTRGRTHRDFFGIRPVHLILTTLFASAVAAVWMLVGGGDAPASPPPQAETLTPTGTPAERAGTGMGRASISVLEGRGFRVEAPPGFQMHEDDDAHVMTGQDPDVRIRIALDPLHGVDPQLVEQEMNQLITADPVLEPQVMVEPGRIGYREDPGDGSEVAWVTWFEDDTQITVGCHTRLEPTVVQKAVCRQVTDSLEIG